MKINRLYNVKICELSFTNRLIGFTTLVALFTSISVSTFSQQLKAQDDPLSEKFLRINALFRDTTLAAPELNVFVKSVVLSSNSILDSRQKLEIYEEAYRTAGEARNSLKKRLAPVRGVPVDTHAGYLSYAFELNMDSLTLRSAIIRRMLDTDKERARQMIFELNGKLGLKAVPCSEMLVYDVSDIYRTVAAVAETSFDAKEVEEGVRALYLVPWLENITSPAQIGPALDLLAAFQSLPTERQILTSALSRAMSKHFEDDRSMTFVLERDRIGVKVYNLTTGIDDQSKTELRIAYRDMLVRNLRSGRCAGNEISDPDELPAYIREANQIFQDRPLNFEDIQHTEILEKPLVVQYWQSILARRLSGELRSLRTNKEGRAITDEDKAGEEWQVRVTAFLDSLNAWLAEGDETESEVFNQKAVLYRTLIAMLPEGDLKIGVFRSYMRFLHTARMQKENFIEWYFHVRTLANEDKILFHAMLSEFPNQNFRVIGLLAESQL